MSEHRRLTKPQARVFVALAQQRLELQRAFQEIVEAEREQIEMLRGYFGLPEGAYRVRQEADGTVLLFAVSEPKDTEQPNEEPT